MASSTAPPVIPITNAPITTNAAGSADVASPSTVRLLLSCLSDATRRSLADRRPWSELSDVSAFSRPESLSAAAARGRKNLAYFRVNYATVVAAALAAALLAHPLSLLVLLVLLFAWCSLYLFRGSDQAPVAVLGREFSDRETLGGLALLTVLVVFLTSVGSLIISALTVGAVIVGAHAAFRVPEDLFLDDQEPGGAATGFLSFLGGAASSAAVTVGPAMARV